MARNKPLFFLVVLSCFALSSCNLHRKTGGGGGGGGGNATVSFTLVADTLPTNPSILSFNVSITGITLTPASGTAQTLNPSPSVVDLMRLQSDTAFLGTLPNVVAGAYTVQVALANPEITFLNDTPSAIAVGTAMCPSGAVCPTTLTSCVVKGQIASVDALLKSDGTLELKEFEPLNSAQQDFVEGIVAAINPSSQTQFGIVVTDKPSVATTNSLISALKVGDLLTVNLSSSVNPFLVDTKGLAVDTSFTASFNFFNGQTTTSAIHLGQNIGVHVIAPFTAVNGTTPASATTDTVILRWSRFRATVVSAPSTATTPIN